MAKAYIFPGQGAQFPGMAKDLYDSFESVRDLFDRAASVLGFDIGRVMFEGSSEDLKQTSVTQPAVFLHSVAAFLASGCGAPSMVAGHSLGEYSALVAAGALDFEDAMALVAVRAAQMQLCCEKLPGTMAAVIGMDPLKVEEICKATPGLVVPANFNSDVQTVISGEKEAVAAAGAAIKAAGAKRVLPLPVGGAFHSPLMEPAREALAKAIEKTAFHKPLCPIYQNITAAPETAPEAIKANLLAQLTGPVRWALTIRAMRSDGADEFVECGPGTVLTGLLKFIA